MKKWLPAWLVGKRKSSQHDPQAQTFIDSLDRLTRQQIRYQPWVALIGPHHAGKTSLCQAADLDIVDTPPSTQFSMWQNSQSMLITFGDYFLTHPHFWRPALKVLRKRRRRQPFDAVALTIHLPYLTQQPSYKTDKLLEQLSSIAGTLAQASANRLPVYVVFTHCDLIAGFNEFFAYLTQEQRQQVWGVLFQQDFDSAWQAFMTDLHQQTFAKLHPTHGTQHSQLIKEFPLQLETLTHFFQTLHQLLQQTHPKIVVAGFCFTSGEQVGTPINYLTTTINRNAELNFTTQAHKTLRQTPYFCHQLLQRLLPFGTPATKSYYGKRSRRGRGWIACAFLIGLSLTSGYLIHQFKQTALTLRHAQYELQSHLFYKLSDAGGANLFELIGALRSLADVEQQLAAQKSVWLFAPPFRELAALRQDLTTTQQQISQRQLLPLLAHHLEQTITDSEKVKPEQTYRTLKAYLMLGNPDQLDGSYFIRWLEIYLQHSLQFSAAQVAQVLPAIQATITVHPTPIALDRQVIRQARQQLAQLPAGWLVYLLIKEQRAMDVTSNTIPYLFTPAGFQAMMQSFIPQAIAQLHSGDEILGHIVAKSSLSLQQLREETLQVYAQDYINWWQSFIPNRTLFSLETLAQIQQTFNQLAGEQSPLIEMLLLIEENTSPLGEDDAYASLFNQHIANQFADISHINEQTIQTIQSLAQRYAQMIVDLSQQKSLGAASLHQLKTLAQTMADTSLIEQDLQLSAQQPEAIHSLLTQLIEQSWRLIGKQAADFLNQQWQQSVYRPYQQTIANHFPLNHQAKQETSLADFHQFFKRAGILQTFYLRYLADFIDIQQTQWLIKPLKVEGFELSQTLITELQRANIIRQMFFNATGDDLAVSYQLQPLAFAANTSHIALHIDGQKLFDYPGSTRITTFKWPKATADAELVIQSHGNPSFHQQWSGDWGWYRLFQSLQVEATEDTRHYTVGFQNNNGSLAAQYQLTTDKIINPFIPAIVQYFQLPEQLVE
ncbi:MAG: hypothetical protein GKR77_03125 [Legionellales bacterium]|nr:hypothetical protein [Legionellales bacterium]